MLAARNKIIDGKLTNLILFLVRTDGLPGLPEREYVLVSVVVVVRVEDVVERLADGEAARLVKGVVLKFALKLYV